MHNNSGGQTTVAIVGGGAIGAALVDVLIAKLTDRDKQSSDRDKRSSDRDPARAKPRIVLFEKSERIGRGLAYARDESPYLLNQSAQTMSLVPGRRTHFGEWLERRGLARPGEDALFCSRQVFGDYAEDCFSRSLERARSRGIVVSTVRDEVSTLAPRSLGGYRVETRAHAPLDADVVVLAIGNVRSTRLRALEGPRFFASPYPGTDLRRIPEDARIAILGSGLSAIDAALALFAAGHEAPVTMASRSGLLPAVRGPLPPLELHHVTRENIARETDHGRRPLAWSTVLRWLELEAERCGQSLSLDRDFPSWVDPLEHTTAQVTAAERGPRVWQAIGEALNPMIEIVWHHLAADAKRLFLEHFYSRFMSHWVPIPLVNGRRVLELLRARKLSVERGLGGVTYDASASAYRLQLPDRVAEVDFVIDATGGPRHLSECDSPLLASLLRQGTIAPHDCGGLRVDFDSLRVIGRDGRTDASLFALGNLTSGTHLFTSTLELNVEKADRLAAQIVAELHRPRERDPRVDATPHPS